MSVGEDGGQGEVEKEEYKTYTGRPRVIFNLLPEAPPRLGREKGQYFSRFTIAILVDKFHENIPAFRHVQA